MKYLSLFSGIGGFELGIQKAYELPSVGVESEDSSDSESQPSQHREHPLCIGFSEIDKYATAIYQKHFPEHKNYGDITNIRAEDLPYFDLLVGGFPCQAFSIAGKRGGFEDTRGTLIFDVLRILKEKQPRLCVLENVKGLLSHDGGRTFKTIITSLAQLGYAVEWQVLNAKDFGVPQNRERVFIVGHIGGFGGRQVFPFGTSDSLNPQSDAQGNEVAYGIQAGGDKHRGSYISNPKMQNYKKDYENSVAITATSCKEPPVVDSIRRLTPTECERLMSYPDGWTEGVSDTQRYKTLGNGIVSNVVAEVIKKLNPLTQQV